MMPRARTMWLPLACVVAGCTNSGTAVDSDPPRASSPSPTYDAFAGLPQNPEHLSVPGACRAFLDTTANLRLTDAQLGERYSAIASRTADEGLATAISRVGQAYAHGQATIYSSEVMNICRP
jgi:hypothetical protein